jgi:acyl-CoA thioesterase-1
MFNTWLSSLICLSFSLPALAAGPSKRLVILGDSLTEGYGVTREEAYPALLQKKITAAGKNWQVVNSGVTGSTSASGVSRLNWILKQKPDLLLLELGGNDGLRGLAPEALETNLADVIALAQKNSLKVILMGVKLPPNYGQDYNKKFEAVFPRLAKHFHIELIPFFLERVAGQRDLNQPDGIHPTAKGHAIAADDVYQAIQKYL